MLSRSIYHDCCRKAIEYFNKAGIILNEQEKSSIQVAEYDLNCVQTIGLELVEYVNTKRCCAKELVLFPGQTCPEHRHPPVFNEEGKEETFRCRYGIVYLYIEGPASKDIKAVIPKGREQYFTCRNEIVLKAGEQFTILPNTLHWFQGGPEGCVVSEFSTTSRDEFDLYTDPQIDPAQLRMI